MIITFERKNNEWGYFSKALGKDGFVTYSYKFIDRELIGKMWGYDPNYRLPLWHFICEHVWQPINYGIKGRLFDDNF